MDTFVVGEKVAHVALSDIYGIIKEIHSSENGVIQWYSYQSGRKITTSSNLGRFKKCSPLVRRWK